MASFPPYPSGETILLSAGPRAGKSTLLTHWRSTLSGPVAHLALTPEDAEAEFFRHRLLQPWPDVQARFAELAARFSASWGALLGRAIAETHPDFTLLLDDLHVVEGTALLPELLALFRQFPAKGSLAIASRHRIPAPLGRPATLLGPEDPCWQERPEAEDLLELPLELQSAIILLHLLGDGAQSPVGRELVRRNIARLDDSSLRLRASWRGAAEAVMVLASQEGLWDRLEEPIEDFRRKHARGLAELRLPRMLDAIPLAIRKRHPYFLQLQGDLRLDAGQVDLARTAYRQALSRTHDHPERELSLLLRLARAALRIPDLAECRSLIERIEGLTTEPTELQQATIANVKGFCLGYEGEFDRAMSALLEVVAIPDSGDRGLAHERMLALSFLAKLHAEQGEESLTDYHFKQAIALATEYRLHMDLLVVHLTRLAHMVSNQSYLFPIQEICELPNECFTYLSPNASFNLLYTMGIRADRLGEGALAERYFAWAKQWATAHDLPVSTCHSSIGLMHAYCSLGRFEEAHQVHADLLRSPCFEGMRYFIQDGWALALLDAGYFQEAEALLEEELILPYAEPVRTQLRFHLHCARYLGGDQKALDEIRAMLDPASGSGLGRQDGRLLRRLGLEGLPPVYRLRAFGPLAFQRDDRPPLAWTRKKPMVLLGHLMLKPAGIASESLAEALFGDPEDLESLHTCAYRLRQGLKDTEAGDLVEALRGTYRLRWDRIAHCDLHEFDALYGKARSLEAAGLSQAAALFYGLALRIVAGSLFEDLPKEFEAERARYVERCLHAQDFVRAHRFLTANEPLGRPTFG